jgi:multidrug efflux pump subunit AcrB
MWIVKLALSQPHTFTVMSILIFLFGLVSIKLMPVDVFPPIDVPIVSCVWTYTGMSPGNVEKLITSPTERAFASTVNGMERIESMSLNGMSIIKVFLHKGIDIGQAVAQVASTGNAVLKTLPQNITPPFVTQSSATDVPVLQLVISSSKLNEAELFDLGMNFVRVQLAVVNGANILFPYGGKYRQVSIDLNPTALLGYGLSPKEVVDAINAQSVIAPSGTAKLGKTEYWITLNNMPDMIEKLNSIPIKHVGSATVYVKDVAFVHDGYQPQLNLVNLNGQRSVVMSILKNGSASTLSVVDQVKELLPKIRAIMPKSVSVDVLTDQSIYVRECVKEVFQEAVGAAGLTALFMLAILGSWRSTLIVVSSIPLAMLTAVIGLHVTGNTINSMTLGGLALAVGMLVDDATVEIENVHRQMDMGKHVVQAILDGAQEVALPAFVSTLSICIVFLPVYLLTEPSRSLFIPLGLAVSFAMLASYGLSRTIVPLMSKHLFAAEEHTTKETDGSTDKKPGFWAGIHRAIDTRFNQLRDGYYKLLGIALNHSKATICAFLAFYALSFCLLPYLGRDFFPPIDAGQIRLHLNVPAGTRVEQTERIFRKVENAIASIIPKDEIEVLTDNIGIPVSGVNYAFSDSQTIGEADGEILVTLTEKRKNSTWDYQKQIREMLSHDFPDCSYYFQPADIMTQILNAGLPAPINIKILGSNQKENLKLAMDIKRAVSKIPGAVDVCMHQVINSPEYFYEVDRTRADQMGITQTNISDALLISLSSSFQVSPNFWVNYTNGVQYYLEAYTPQYRFNSANDIGNIPIVSSSTASQSTSSTLSQSQASESPQQQPVRLLANVATPIRRYVPYVVNHVNVQPVFDVNAACQMIDLGSVADAVQKVIDAQKKTTPKETTVLMSGQLMMMNGAFAGLLLGLVGALILVYLLLVVNYQSWVDPLIILMAIPGALCGIIWCLFVTQTTLSVPAFMGTIMTIGVASANSILLVTFCNEQLREGKSAKEAAHTAGFQRFRPVCMTAAAMVLGMIPMSLSSGINAPIGRAVIGGLSAATLSTLFFVPIMFTLIKKIHTGKQANKQENLTSEA